MFKTIRKLLGLQKKKINIYHLLGGERGIKLLVDEFYKYMETHPSVVECLLLHELDNDKKVPSPLKSKLYMFLSGWFGGPNLFIENFGHPRMRARHIKFKISERERAQWIECMTYALKVHRPKVSKKNLSLILNSFIALSHRITNAT